YVERAEQTARVTDATLGHTLTMGSTPEAEVRRARHWAALLEIVGERPVVGEQEDAGEEQVTTHLLYSHANPNSIAECIARARENARTMRNMRATEMWETLNRFHLDVQRPGRRRRRIGEGTEAASRFCTGVVDFSQLMQGVTNSTMPREEGWYFLQAGKFLER